VTKKTFEGIDLCDPKSHDNPWEMYTWMLEERPLYWDPNNEVWYVWRYDDIVTLSRDPETFTSTNGNRPNLPPDPSMIHQDGEQHRKQRALVAQGFSPKFIRKMDEDVRDIARQLLGRMIDRGEGEIVEDLAARLPMAVIARMIGVPPEKEDTLRHWVDTFVGGGQGPAYVSDEVNEAFSAFIEHHEGLMAERADNLGDDLLSTWIKAEIDGEKLNDEQLLFEHTLLTVGGSETTRNAIAGGIEELIRHPDQWDYLAKNRDAIPNAVEEIIRWVCPFVNMFRTATRDVEMHGQVIKEGQMIGLMYPAANREAKYFPEPFKFDVRRNFETKHIAFGYGAHFCLGSNLARLEIRAVLEEMFDMIERFEFKPGTEVEWVSSSFVRGPKTIPVLVKGKQR
jgi:cytochrome P450 family 142 subfamily A polypeptide 1